MIKISISGDSDQTIKDKAHLAIVHALGPIAEQFPADSFQISIRKEREKKIVNATTGVDSNG